MTLYFDDLQQGETYELGTVTVDEDEMVAFARRFDPQPFHVDPVAAKESSFGELVASGWYTMSLFMRLYVDRLLMDSASQGSPGGDQFRWHAPVRAGDTLVARLHVEETRASSKRPDRGGALMRGELLRDGEPVLTVRFVGLFGRRPAACGVESRAHQDRL